jgi:ribitol 2-dehydrogenase
MNTFSKALLFGAAGLLAYRYFSRRAQVDLNQYYRGKVAVVTGGASGIGRAVAAQLLGLGARVLAVDRNAEALEQLSRDFRDVETLAIDLGEGDAPARVLDEACARFGHLDLLFNNAGIVYIKPFWEMSVAEIERLVAINFTMQIRMTHAILPYFFERNAGVIAYTGSLSAHVYSPSHSVYTGTKGGLHNFVAAVRRELPQYCGVQLTIIHPNVTRTNLTDASNFDLMEPYIRLQSPEEVANVFLRAIARGAKEVFVRPMDNLYKWAERLLPTYADGEFRKLMDMDPSRKQSNIALANR